jgi:hypothetical protein
VARRCGEEEGADLARADVVDVPQQPERGNGLHPLGPYLPHLDSRRRLRRRLSPVLHDAPGAVDAPDGQLVSALLGGRFHRHDDGGLPGILAERFDPPHTS